MVSRSHTKGFSGAQWDGGSQFFCLQTGRSLNPTPNLGSRPVFLGLHVPPSHLVSKGFSNRGFWEGCCGADQVDTSVLLAAGLPTASAVACQGSINFLLEESVRTTEWICFSQRQLSALVSALGGCRGQGGTRLGTSEQRQVGQCGWGRLPGGGEDGAGRIEMTMHVGQAGEFTQDTWSAGQAG